MFRNRIGVFDRHRTFDPIFQQLARILLHHDEVFLVPLRCMREQILPQWVFGGVSSLILIGCISLWNVFPMIPMEAPRHRCCSFDPCSRYPGMIFRCCGTDPRLPQPNRTQHFSRENSPAYRVRVEGFPDGGCLPRPPSPRLRSPRLTGARMRIRPLRAGPSEQYFDNSCSHNRWVTRDLSGFSWSKYALGTDVSMSISDSISLPGRITNDGLDIQFN